MDVTHWGTVCLVEIARCVADWEGLCLSLVLILHKMGLCDLYKSYGIIMVVKCRKVRWAALKPRMRAINAFRILVGKTSWKIGTVTGLLRQSCERQVVALCASEQCRSAVTRLMPYKSRICRRRCGLSTATQNCSTAPTLESLSKLLSDINKKSVRSTRFQDRSIFTEIAGLYSTRQC